ncbi:MAG: CsbD family protein [Gammaproteobacteria bacterium]|nr:CsbD family protein [Gammaproteobacteria bacterium]
MNSDIFEGKWKQLKGQIKTRWGKLTDDDIDVAEGHSQYLAGKLQERYGVTKEKAEEEIAEFNRKL